MSTGTVPRVEDIAQELFEVLTQVALSTQPRQRRGVELKDLEFLTLSIVHVYQPIIVGDIQRLLSVLPAQMSRIIRSLENRDPPFIQCQINQRDKRKIDVRMTDAGFQALMEYQEQRVAKLAALLRGFSEDEQEDVMQLVHRLNDLLERRREN